MSHLEILEKAEFLRQIASYLGVQIPVEVIAKTLDEIQSLIDAGDYQGSDDDRVLLKKQCRAFGIFF